MKHSHRVYDPLKRTLDVLASAAALVVLSPVLLVVAVLVRRRLGNPVLFSQQRPGKNAHLFRIYKFRTMGDTPPGLSPVEAVDTDADRLTQFGRGLRSTSLDELPEFWNVLRGDMSIVGPRPLLAEYLDRYNSEQARRHEVRPGITGWAQVNGRNATTWDQRLAMDVWYVDHRSFWLDLRILGMTVAAALGRKGISAEGSATMPPFDPQAQSDLGSDEDGVMS